MRRHRSEAGFLGQGMELGERSGQGAEFGKEPMRDFEGKVVTVTGGNSGLGAATGVEFARQGRKWL